jgi:hypothetical protein
MYAEYQNASFYGERDKLCFTSNKLHTIISAPILHKLKYKAVVIVVVVVSVVAKSKSHCERWSASQ